jgi:hypothetical protein
MVSAVLTADPPPRLRIDVGYTVRYNIEAEEAGFDPADAMLVSAIDGLLNCTLLRDGVIVGTAHTLELVEVNPPPPPR